MKKKASDASKNNVPKLRFSEFSNEWEEKRLGDISSISTGSSNRQDSNLSGKYTFFDRSNEIRKSDQYLFEGEVVIIPGEGSEFIPKYFNGKFDLHQRTYAVLNFKNVLSKFIFYYVYNYRKYFLRQAVGSTVKSLRMPMFKKMKIQLPSLEEQEKIASFLSVVDKKIKQFQELKEQWSSYKRGLMQQIFSQKIRFTKDDGSEFEDWEEKRLGEITKKESSSLTKISLDNKEGEYPVYGAGGFIQNIASYDQEEPYISIVKDGAGVGRLTLNPGQSSILGTLDIIKNQEGFSLSYLYYHLNTIRFERYIIGTTIPHIYYKDYKKLKLRVPSPKEQEKIALFLLIVDSKVDSIENKLKEIRKRKKGLLQQMFV